MKKFFTFPMILFCISCFAQSIQEGSQQLMKPIQAEGILSIEDKGDYKVFEIVNYAQIEKMHDATLRDRISSLEGIKSFGITWAEMKMTIAIENKYIVKYLTEELSIPASSITEFNNPKK